jgi:hypothetical protein
MMTRDDSEPEIRPSDEMEDMLAGHFVAQCLHAAAVLGIPDLLKDRPMTVSKLAVATGTHEPFLHRLLCSLASKGVLSGTSDGQFQLTPLGDTLRSNAPDSLRDKAIFEAAAPLWAAVGGLLDTLRSGQPSFPKLYDESIYQYLAENADLAAVFNSFMTAQSVLHNAAIVEAYDFSGIRTIIDVGGGQGATLAAILKSRPDMQGVLFDLPEVIADVSLKTMGLTGRCAVLGGDMLTAVPVDGDAYVIKRVMMDKTDEDAVAVLRNCLAAMNAGGRVLVIDPMLPDVNETHNNWLADILMMVVTYGKCRTQSQFQELFDAAGFKLTRVIKTSSPNFIVEGVRP